MTMGDKIYNLRTKNGLTLEELGNSVGVGKSTVRKWEKGMIANMKRDKIAKLAFALGTTPAYLMGWDEEEPAVPNTELSDIEESLLSDFRKLNDAGKSEASKRVEELTFIPRYTDFPDDPAEFEALIAKSSIKSDVG